MSDIEQVQTILSRLAPHGWDALFLQHGIDIYSNDLEKELQKTIQVNRNLPGFQEFAIEGQRAITPSQPAQSLLYHAFASPHVRWADIKKTSELTMFPALEDIEAVENYVYASGRLSLEEIEQQYNGETLAVVMFANQYRPARNTLHKKHADMVYSRTGIARAGNKCASYDKMLRSFIPLSDDPNETRVLPAKYNAYIAVKTKGNKGILGDRYNVGVRGDPFSTQHDEKLSFWVPVHKLFNGTECLLGKLLTLEYQSHHRNEKIAKIHEFVGQSLGQKTGTSCKHWEHYPFRFDSNIAEYHSDENIVVPMEHRQLVKRAKRNNRLIHLRKNVELPYVHEKNALYLRHSSLLFTPKQVTVRNRPNKNDSLTLFPHSVPEFMHIRTEVTSGFTGQIRNLNREVNLLDFLKTRKYSALHYVDYTGDGYLKVSQVRGGGKLNDWLSIAAYSIISPPDFFPYCDQTEIFDDIRLRPLWTIFPFALCDTRLLPNIKSHPELYYETMSMMDTCTAIISGTRDKFTEQTPFDEKIHRVSYLPDSAAGVFSAGWDISFDTFYHEQEHIPHLAAYGLASPFSENAKLCANINSFCPGVMPDITRTFWSSRTHGQTILPLTDEEIGMNGQMGWDGEIGPLLYRKGEEQFVSYADFDHVDYTNNTTENRINYHVLSEIDAEEYTCRVLHFAKVKSAPTVSDNMKLLSYTIKYSKQVRIERYLLSEMEDTGSRDGLRAIVRRKRSIWLELKDGKNLKIIGH